MLVTGKFFPKTIGFGIPLSLVIAGGVTIIADVPARASSLNLTSWQTLGDVAIESPTRASLSTDGLRDDDADLGVGSGTFNFSSNPATAIGSGNPPLLEDFLGIDVSQLDLDDFAYEGSALKTTISVKSGDTLSFNYQFLTNETVAPLGPFNDYGFLLVDRQVIELADVGDALNPSSFFASETLERTYFYRFTQARIYTLAFGAIDIRDYPLTSALLISNVTLTPESLSVPESNSTLAMITLGIVGGGLLFRRHWNSR